jgi:hypothetical protein
MVVEKDPEVSTGADKARDPFSDDDDSDSEEEVSA